MRYAQAAAVFFMILAAPIVICYAEGEIKGLRQYERWDTGTIRSCTLFDMNGQLKAKAYCRHDGTVEKVE
ncbi:MAG: hypothetical protein PHX20_07650, partial [Candidatus Omnitrophica bacterium]|nr:hypothetical protein [Candidatus Omnitrophota bacterium]